MVRKSACLTTALANEAVRAAARPTADSSRSTPVTWRETLARRSTSRPSPHPTSNTSPSMRSAMLTIIGW